MEGVGVVVPHRAQRADLQERVPALTVIDPVTGAVTLSAVDTVERFQGGERTVILVGATESDREYLLASSQFLLDPRRLTVALSRAKRKMVLVAARSVFELFSADEETFANSQLWKNLLRRTCTVPLWTGDRAGHHGHENGDREDGQDQFVQPRCGWRLACRGLFGGRGAVHGVGEIFWRRHGGSLFGFHAMGRMPAPMSTPRATKGTT